MNLYPQDLRDNMHLEVVCRRAYPAINQTTNTLPEVTPHLGYLGRIWSAVLPVNSKQAASIMPATTLLTQVQAWVVEIYLMIIAAVGIGILAGTETITPLMAWVLMSLAFAAITWLSFVALPRKSLGKLYKKPVTTGEIEKLIPGANTNLERSYLELIRHAVLQPVPEGAEADVRAAVASLGEAMDALPLIDPVQTDTGLLRGEAAALRAQARAETDTVVADSLSYQADAILRRADAADRSAQYARRIAALRREIAAQIAAVQEDLSTFNSTGGAVVDRIALSHLADGARRVATISVSAANARAELDSVSSPLLRQRVTSAEEPSVQTVQNLQRTIK